jgi:hypothetical protein
MQLQWDRQWKRRATFMVVLLAAMAGAWKAREADLSTQLFALQPPPGTKPSGPPQSASLESDLANPTETSAPLNGTPSTQLPSNDSSLIAPPGLDLTPQPIDPDDPTLATIRDLLLERSRYQTPGQNLLGDEEPAIPGSMTVVANAPSARHWIAIEAILKGARLLEAEAVASSQHETPGTLAHEQATAARQLRQQARKLLLLTP